jgi:hypothetical protein
LYIGHDIIGADVEVLIGEVVADLLAIEEEDLEPVQTGGSGVVAVLTAWCGGFPSLLRLRDQNSSNVGGRVRSR